MHQHKQGGSLKVHKSFTHLTLLFFKPSTTPAQFPQDSAFHFETKTTLWSGHKRLGPPLTQHTLCNI